MTVSDIKPDSDRVRRFVVEGGTSLGPPGGGRHIASREDTAGDPLAEAVFSVAGVQEVVIEQHAVAVLARADASWDEMEERVRYAIGKALEQPGMADGAGGGEPLDDDAMYSFIDEVLQREINPAIADHGGRIELLDVQDGVATVRMMGGCHGTSSRPSARRSLPSASRMRDFTVATGRPWSWAMAVIVMLLK